MRFKDAVWQGHFGYWQPLFIHENLLAIGHAAWEGWLQHGRGLVSCDVNLPATGALDWGADVADYHLQFLPTVAAIAQVQRLELQTEECAALEQMLATYSPTDAIVLLLTGSGQVQINCLRNLAIAPADCYAQMRQRWQEFQLTPIQETDRDA